MGNLYYAQAADVLRAAGVEVAESSINAGWERRPRSSGGFSAAPLGCVWHHTASNTSPANDLSYMIDGSDDAPIGNMLLDRDGVVWMIAAGGANTQGKGGPHTFSRGTCPLDSGNSQLWGIEVANAGTGQDWPQIQVDAYFKASNALNEMFGNLPTDLITHHEWAEDRKIDPATADAVEGPWRPGSVTGSGTWNGDDIRAECWRRSQTGPAPTPPPNPGDDDLMIGIFESQDEPKQFNAMFFGYCTPTGQSIELQWSGSGDDPAVRERIDVMKANFPTFNLTLAGVKNNRLSPPHKPSDINDSLHRWVDSDFAPSARGPVDWTTLFTGIAAILTGAGGCILVIREVTRRDRAAMRTEMAELSADVTDLRHDLVLCRRYAFDLAEHLANHGIDPPEAPPLRTAEGR